MVASRRLARQSKVSAKAKRRRFLSPDFRQTKCSAHDRCARTSGGMGFGKTCVYASRLPPSLLTAERRPGNDRLQCAQLAAPAAILGLLKREGFLDPDALRYPKTIPVARLRGARLARSRVPAGA